MRTGKGPVLGVKALAVTDQGDSLAPAARLKRTVKTSQRILSWLGQSRQNSREGSRAPGLKSQPLFRLLFLLLVAVPGYPPDQTILLTEEPGLTLRWKLPGRKFRVELVDGNGPVQSQLVDGQSWVVRVRPGGQYTWRVIPEGSAPLVSHFSVAEKFEYRAQGRTGSPGKNGTNGGQPRVRLAKEEAGMNLWIWDRETHRHFLFLGKPKRFLISARGGDGGKGQDGIEFAEAEAARGQAGGSAGWGGMVEVTTRDAPWRQYLEIEVAPGQPGEGGKGGRYYRQGVLERGADGQPGQSGRPGRVTTVIEP